MEHQAGKNNIILHEFHSICPFKNKLLQLLLIWSYLYPSIHSRHKKSTAVREFICSSIHSSSQPASQQGLVSQSPSQPAYEVSSTMQRVGNSVPLGGLRGTAHSNRLLIADGVQWTAKCYRKLTRLLSIGCWSLQMVSRVSYKSDAPFRFCWPDG